MWALVENNKVKEVTVLDPVDRFHTDMVWKVCGADVEPGWAVDGDTFHSVEPNVYPLVSLERAWRDYHLSSTGWLLERHKDEVALSVTPTLSPEFYLQLLEFRQSLRDWPASVFFPDATKRPALPKWLNL